MLAGADTDAMRQLKRILTDLGYCYTYEQEPDLLAKAILLVQPEIVFITESYLQSSFSIDIDELKCMSHTGGFASIMVADRLGEYMSGIDATISYPLTPKDVAMKLNLAVRSKNYHLRVTGSYQDKEKELHTLRREVNLTERMLSRIARQVIESPSGVRQFSLPKLHVSGDMAIFWDSAEASRYVMVGDVTGHGLSSAVAVMVIRSLFMEIVSSQHKLSLPRLVSTLNNRIYEILPDEMFFTAAFIKLAHDVEKIEIWNAAMPDVLILDTQHGSVKAFPSVFMPLGVSPMREEDVALTESAFSQNSLLYVLTDGFTDYYEAAGEVMNGDRLLDMLACCDDPNDLYQRLLDDFHQLVEDEVKDDVTVVEVSPLNLQTSFVI